LVPDTILKFKAGVVTSLAGATLKLKPVEAVSLAGAAESGLLIGGLDVPGILKLKVAGVASLAGGAPRLKPDVVVVGAAVKEKPEVAGVSFAGRGASGLLLGGRDVDGPDILKLKVLVEDGASLTGGTLKVKLAFVVSEVEVPVVDLISAALVLNVKPELESFGFDSAGCGGAVETCRAMGCGIGCARPINIGALARSVLTKL
jgi:hypothetical protein